MSDGFCDQLEMVNENKTKYNIPNILKLLAEISKEKNFTERHHQLNDQLNKWKGNCDQTDDVILIGIKILKLNK